MSKKINPWIISRVGYAESHSSPARYLIEVKPNELDSVKAQITEITGVEFIQTSADRYIVAVIPSEVMSLVANISGVEKISADTVAYIKRFGFFSTEVFDPWVGQVGLSSVEIEHGPLDIPFAIPMKIMAQEEETIFTTEQTRSYLKVPDNSAISTRVAVLDTGLFLPHTLMLKSAEIRSYTDEPPLDGQGHGTWCSTAAFGDEASHPIYGACKGIANPEEQLHGKVLSNAGFGMTSWILDGMYDAVKEYGAKIVSMSLGGPLQGSPIHDDPMCRLVTSLSDDAIFVVAAGNEGPDHWTIGSPGACPDALTVASWGITRNATAGFSSRGPSGDYYKDNHEAWRKDAEIARYNLIKPDLACPGGDDLAQEKLLSGCAGWYDAIADPIPQWGTMMGTSMATPHAAGLIALAYDRGIIKSANDVRRIMSESLQDPRMKSIDYGYGLLTWDTFAPRA